VAANPLVSVWSAPPDGPTSPCQEADELLEWHGFATRSAWGRGILSVGPTPHAALVIHQQFLVQLAPLRGARRVDASAAPPQTHAHGCVEGRPRALRDGTLRALPAHWLADHRQSVSRLGVQCHRFARSTVTLALQNRCRGFGLNHLSLHNSGTAPPHASNAFFHNQPPFKQAVAHGAGQQREERFVVCQQQPGRQQLGSGRLHAL
jgi:hypothetical protein